MTRFNKKFLNRLRDVMRRIYSKYGYSLLIFEALTFCKLSGYSQGEFNNWYFGANAAMTFNNGPPVALAGSAMGISVLDMPVSVSDSAGNLLFYASGWRAWTRNNTYMPNSIGLLGGINQTRQSGFAVPGSGNKNQYYLFTVGSPNVSPVIGLNYSIVDMTLNGGLGDILPGFKNIPLTMGDSAVGQLTGIRHANNRDVWVIAYRHGAVQKYLAYLVTSAGISSPVLSASSLKYSKYSKGTLRCSPDGLNLVCSDSITEVSYFNPASGEVTRRYTFLPFYMGNPVPANSTEFSIDSKYLYCIATDGMLTTNTPLWQFDVTKADSVLFMQSGFLLGVLSAGSIQMAPDGKIYLTHPVMADYTLNRINNPSVHGTGCNYEMSVINLLGNINNGSLPQFLQRYKAYIHSVGQCQGHPVAFTSDIWPPADSIRWDFGDPASGANNISIIPGPSHVFANPGTYTVTLYVRHNDNRTDTTHAVINILPSHTPEVNGPATAAIGQTTTYTTQAGMTGYTWSVSSGGIIASGGTPTDNTVSITWNATGTHQVFVNYTNANGCMGVSPAVINVTVGAGPPALYEYWFAAPAVTYQRVNWYNMNNPIAFYLMTAEGPATVTIDQPANPSFVPIIKTVNNDSAREVYLTPFIDMVENSPANTILNRGLHITSDKQISVIYEVESPLNAATYTLGGKNALGYEFIIPAQSHFSNHPDCSPPARNSFDIVATEDSTLVRILPKQAIIGHAANDTFSVILNRGQTWSGRATSGDSTKHLGGSFVFADKPVAVTVTDDAMFIPGNSESVDITGDQLMPRHLCGKEFIPVSYLDATKLKLMIYAFENGTHVTLTDTSYMLTADLNRGESTEMILDIDPTLPISMGYAGYLVSNKPILVYQQTEKTILFPSETRQAGACILPPASCAGSYRVCLPRTPPYSTGSGFYTNHIYWTIVTKNGNQGNFQVSGGLPVAVGGFHTVPGTNGAYVFGISNVTSMNGIIPNIIFTNSTGRFQLASGSTTNNISVPTYNYFKYSCYSDYATLSLGLDRLMCPGDSVFLDAGFGMTSYLWNTGETTQTIWAKTTGTFWVNTTEPDCQLNDTIVISYYPETPVDLGPDRSICAGDSVLLNAGPGRAWYLWNTGTTTPTIWAKTSGTYWVKAADVHCDVSDTISITTLPPPVIPVGPNAKTICSGENTQLALSSNPAASLFSWVPTLISGNITGFSTDSGLIIDDTLINNGSTPGVVVYHVTPKIGGCTGETVDFTVTVTPDNPVAVGIVASGQAVCAGTTVTFIATPVNGGANPSYQWKVNGVNLGTNSPTFSYIPSDGDQIFVICHSSFVNCISNNPAFSDTLTMIVYQPATVSVSITTPSNAVCLGETASFTASTINAGSSPFFEWQVNGNNLGPNSPTFSYQPSNGDVVSCRVSSSAACVTGSPAMSNSIAMTVSVGLPASVSIAAIPIPFCEGSSVTLNATATNGGANPSWQWIVNGQNQGSNAATYGYVPQPGDSVRCVMTSNLACVSSNPALSNKIVLSGSPVPHVSFSSCFDTITTINAKPFQLKGGLPLGGTYTGPGVNTVSGMFDPASAGVGVHLLGYSYTNANGCVSSAIRNVQCVNSVIFMCGGTLTDIRDGKTYPTVQIGSQCWMQANLEFGRTIDEWVPQTDNCLPEYYTTAGDSPSSHFTFHSYRFAFINSNLKSEKIKKCESLNVKCDMQSGGALYQWDELMGYNSLSGSQGLCPPGWHVPTEAEWTKLTNFYNGSSQAGRPLQDTVISGFRVHPDGIFYLNSSWSFADFAVLFWTSTPWGSNKALSHGMNTITFSVSLYPAARANAFPVRCLHD